MLPGRGRSAASSATRPAGAWLVNRARTSSGPVKIRARAWLMAWVRCARAVRLGDHQRPDRPGHAITSSGRPDARPDWAARAALTASRGPGLARPPAVLPVRAVHPGNPDPGRGDVPGQASAVAAGALDADHAHRAKPPQPGQQPGIAVRGSGELLYAEQSADPVQRRGHMAV